MIDGVKAATVYPYSSGAHARKMAFTKSWVSLSSHTLGVRVLGANTAALKR